MIKVTLIFGSLLAVAYSASLFQTDDTETTCLYKDQLWGSVDATKFYFCDDTSVIEQTCPENTFFVRNDTVTGCLPYDVVNPNCVHLEPVEGCVGINLNQPQASKDPTKFYLCTGENAQPLELPCPDGQAFINKGGYLGCFVWPRWRQIKDCLQ